LSRILKRPPISNRPYRVPKPDTRAGKSATAKNQTESERPDPESEARRIVQQAQAKADALREQAQAESQQVLSEARSEAEQLRRTAQEEGLQEGRQQGRDEMEEQRTRQAKEFQRDASALLEAIHQQKQKLLRESEPRLVELAAMIAGQIVRKEVRQDDDTVLNIVRQAIVLATEKDQLLLRLNPEDLGWIRERCPELMALHEDIKEIHFEEDRRVERGGCVIETAAGNVDARIERQLDEIRRGLEEMV